MNQFQLYLCSRKKSSLLFRIYHEYNLILKANLYILKRKSEFESKLTLFLCIFVFHVKTSNKDPPHSFLSIEIERSEYSEERL